MESGFSRNLLKTFMQGEEFAEDGPMTPEGIMMRALERRSFEGLEVLD